jgi:hypothetical protein
MIGHKCLNFCIDRANIFDPKRPAIIAGKNCKTQTERDRGRQRETERDRERQRETERDRERQRDKETVKHPLPSVSIY